MIIVMIKRGAIIFLVACNIGPGEPPALLHFPDHLKGLVIVEFGKDELFVFEVERRHAPLLFFLVINSSSPNGLDFMGP